MPVCFPEILLPVTDGLPALISIPRFPVPETVEVATLEFADRMIASRAGPSITLPLTVICAGVPPGPPMRSSIAVFPAAG